MRKLLLRLSPSSCACRDRVSVFAVACGDCGADLRRPSRPAPRDSALVWLLGGAVVGCVAMLAFGPLGQT